MSAADRAFSAVDEFAARWFVFGLIPFALLVGAFHTPVREALLLSVIVGMALTIGWFLKFGFAHSPKEGGGNHDRT